MLYFANPSKRFLKNSKTEITLIKKFLSKKQYILGKELDKFERILQNLFPQNILSVLQMPQMVLN